MIAVTVLMVLKTVIVSGCDGCSYFVVVTMFVLWWQWLWSFLDDIDKINHVMLVRACDNSCDLFVMAVTANIYILIWNKFEWFLWDIFALHLVWW
jgi:hypothetical protein